MGGTAITQSLWGVAVRRPPCRASLWCGLTPRGPSPGEVPPPGGCAPGRCWRPREGQVRGFTIIELLVVIAIIGVLATLTFPAVRAVRISALRARARSELNQIETAIERYKDKLGCYPPDNPPNWAVNQLYYELLGITNIGSATEPVYATLDGSSRIKASDFGAAFGPNVTGFLNCARPGRGEDTPGAVAFLWGLKPNQTTILTNRSGLPVCTILVSPLDGPPALASGGKVNSWRYNSSSPRYNLKSFDLWIDVMAGDKTNRICNWTDRPLVVGAPY
jgi:prepilin-type N-terminal cleavage/methylation domain-containing protein